MLWGSPGHISCQIVEWGRLLDDSNASCYQITYNHARDPGWELPSWVHSAPRIERDDDTWYLCFMLLNLGWFVTQQSLEQRPLLETLENIHWDGPPSSCLAASQAVPMACVFSKSSVDQGSYKSCSLSQHPDALGILAVTRNVQTTFQKWASKVKSIKILLNSSKKESSTS